MFTGIVEETGRVVRAEPARGGRALAVEARAVIEGMRPGDSVAVNGCCLTATAVGPDRFDVEMVPETLARTTLGRLRVGDRVNLERALRAGDRFGGHFVQGHVDGVGTVVACEPEGNGRRLFVELPGGLLPYVAEKGSIALDGTSLTVAGVSGPRVEVALIPHTLAVTVAGTYRPGDALNVEVDLIARYVARLVQSNHASEEGSRRDS
jgi:riboflavin synthase